MIVFRWFCFLFVLNMAAVSVKAEGNDYVESHADGAYQAFQYDQVSHQSQKSLMFRKVLAWASRKIGMDYHQFYRQEPEAVKGFSDVLTKARYGLDVKRDSYGLTMQVMF